MKKKILDCAIADFLVYGFKNVTMDDLAQKLGISKKTIYDNFSNKQELVAEAANTIFENVSSTIQKIHREEIDPVKSLFDIKKRSPSTTTTYKTHHSINCKNTTLKFGLQSNLKSSKNLGS